MPDPNIGAPDDPVIIGRIRRSHGVLGVLVVEPMTTSPETVFTPGRELIAGTTKGDPATPEQLLRIEMAEPFQGGFRIQFSGIADRNEADRWRNRYVLLSLAALPEPDENQIFLYDLVGLTVEGQGGDVIGRVEAYYELPHDAMIEVARPGGSVMIPYRFVSSVDLEAKRLVIDPPEGLL